MPVSTSLEQSKRGIPSLRHPLARRSLRSNQVKSHSKCGVRMHLHLYRSWIMHEFWSWAREDHLQWSAKSGENCCWPLWPWPRARIVEKSFCIIIQFIEAENYLPAGPSSDPENLTQTDETHASGDPVSCQFYIGQAISRKKFTTAQFVKLLSSRIRLQFKTAWRQL